ncbi:MAG: hypothetical protein WCH39_01675 [Schlesneria sp.]
MPEVPKIKIQFNVDTPIDVKHVAPHHCGRLQIRERPIRPGEDPNIGREQEFYFPAGTVIVQHDFTSIGHADEVHPDTVEASPILDRAVEEAPRLRQITSIDVTKQPTDNSTDGDTVSTNDAAASPIVTSPAEQQIN